MSTKRKVAFFFFLSLGIALFVLLFFYGNDVGILSPKGMIAVKELDLLVVATLLMLIVVIPVLILTAVFAWKYRAGNTKAKYMPDWDFSWLAESIWWGLPCLIVLALSIITWKGTLELDPSKPLSTEGKTMRIQVVALQWKWLFIYPEEGIATVNFVQFPEKVPVRFEITADAPMNSFWIPELGGQIYAMPGMETKLHLIADQMGTFKGVSANLSGTGFAGMRFLAKASSQEEFDEWVGSVKQAQLALGLEEYEKLVAPSENDPQSAYVLADEKLYDQIVMKYK